MQDDDTHIREKIGVVYDGDNFLIICQQNNSQILWQVFINNGIWPCLMNI